MLRKLFLNLEKLKANKDELALKVQEKLRIIVSWGKVICLTWISDVLNLFFMIIFDLKYVIRLQAGTEQLAGCSGLFVI